MGVANDPDFQKDVIRAALNLFNKDSGPVLEDYPVDAPAGITAEEGWACPVNLTVPEGDLSEVDKIKAAFGQEMSQLRSWYDIAVEKRGRTMVGTSNVAVDDLPGFIGTLLDGGTPNTAEGAPLALTTNLVVDDIKAYYSEALTAQPGQENVNSQQLVEWFYNQTAAGKAIFALRDKAASSDDKMLSIVAKALIVPAGR